MSVEPDRVRDPVIEGPLSRELDHYKGRWVAVYESRIIAVSDSALEAKNQALDQGITDPLLFRVPMHSDRIAFL
jgi:Family of unknown function (DUF5678)